MTAPQYIGWALRDLVEYNGFKTIRSELPDLYGKSKLFDAAVVTNRIGRFAPAGLLLCGIFLSVLAHALSGPVLALVMALTFAGMAAVGWMFLGRKGVAIAALVFLPMLFVKGATWFFVLRFVIAIALVVAGWYTLSFLGVLLGGAVVAAIVLMPEAMPLSSLPVAVQAMLFGLVSLAGWAILSTSAVIFVFKAADGISYTELLAEMKQVSRFIPSPGAVDAFEYYGALVLVFEKPVPSLKRDQLISLRRSSPLGRMLTDIWIVELDAGTMYALDTPWNIRKFSPLLQDAISHKGDAPPLPEADLSVGQRLSVTSVAWATLGLLALNAAVHVAVYLDPRESIDLTLRRAGMGHTALEDIGQWWRMLTGAFLHGGWMHLIGNMIGLLEAGRGVEVLFGSWWTVTLYVATALGGDVASYIWQPGMGLGASGAVLGFGGVLASVFLLRGARLSVRYRSHLMVVGLYAVWILVNNFLGESRGIGIWAHLGGFATGAVFGALLPYHQEGQPSPWRGALVGMIATGLIVFAGVQVARNWDWRPEVYEPMRSEACGVVIPKPEGWFVDVDKKGGVLMEDGGSGALEVSRGTGDIIGMFTLSAGELKQWFEEWIRASGEREGGGVGHYWRDPWEATARQEVTDFETSFIALGGGRALSVRFTLRLTGTILEYHLIPFEIRLARRQELILLPLQEGYAEIFMVHAPEDDAYYRPILAELHNRLQTIGPPILPIQPATP